MILPDLELAQLKNQRLLFTGIDSYEFCRDKEHFSNYRHEITYSYNSRGFRDDEWPEDLKSAVWCVGDSFTVGLGSPREHTWPWLLQQQTGLRCINVSMDGASNNWIARRAAQILKSVRPLAMIVQWSYLNRREADLYTTMHDSWQEFYNKIKRHDWPAATFSTASKLPSKILAEISMYPQPFVNDLSRRRWNSYESNEQDIKNTIDLWNSLASNVSSNKTKIVYSTIPKFSPCSDIDTFSMLAPAPFIQVQQLDLARDAHHYDIETAADFVKQISL